MHDAGAAGLRLVLVLVDHPAHPEHFAGQIAVVCAGRSTRGHELGAVERIRTDGRAGDARALGQGAHGRGVGRIADHERQTGRVHTRLDADRLTHGFELGPVAPAQRPAKRRAVALKQILGGEASGETGGAPDDHVELAFRSAHNAHRSGYAEAVL